ncbi:MAG: hypothetical protein QMD46_12355 [Methanomicrobiales archaeon]|nr:hypothetical protein [Methanomicrobiales archaeon]
MKSITRPCLESLRKTHPIEAAIWDGMIRRGEASILEETEDLKCQKK